jgi:phytanoyl-CoA hydroxylase
MLTNNQISDYREKGFLLIPGLLSERTIIEIRDEITRLIVSLPSELEVGYETMEVEISDSSPAQLRKLRHVARNSESIFTHCTQPPITTVARQILGEPIGFYGDQVLFKMPRIGSAKPLHQDAAYFRITPADGVITFWCALDDATVDNGCMHYVAGSHKMGLVNHAAELGTPHLIANASQAKALPVPVKKGDCIVHHSLTLHATPPNLSQNPRWALLLHYVALTAAFPPKSRQASRIVSIAQ